MKRKLPIIIIAIIFLIGIGFLSYPLVSSVINNYSDRSEASLVQSTIDEMTSAQTKSLLKSAKKYNNSLTNNVVLTDPFDESAYESIGADYEAALNVDGDGLIGYIDIPAIDVYLPIYHGTDSSILEKGAGHLENSSLPIGGKSTHSVISAHTGYPGKTFFNYLTDLEEGDVFYVHVLNKTLKYKVDQIKTVLPEDTSDLRIVDGEDYVTLLTCTPYGVNTHRLLVRGTRVKYNPDDSSTVSTISADDGIFIFGFKIPYAVAAAILAALVVIIALIVFFIIRTRRKKNKPSISGETLENEESSP